MMMLVIEDCAMSVCVFVSEMDEKRRELMLQGVPELCCQSDLWEQSVRSNVADNKTSEQVVHHFVNSRNVMQYFPVTQLFILHL